MRKWVLLNWGGRWREKNGCGVAGLDSERVVHINTIVKLLILHLKKINTSLYCGVYNEKHTRFIVDTTKPNLFIIGSD